MAELGYFETPARTAKGSASLASVALAAIYLRAKIGFCTCASAIDDDVVDRVGDIYCAVSYYK